jgi:hypothetical protein
VSLPSLSKLSPSINVESWIGVRMVRKSAVTATGSVAAMSPPKTTAEAIPNSVATWNTRNVPATSAA